VGVGDPEPANPKHEDALISVLIDAAS